MSHSLIRADRTTHLKVLCVALTAAIAVVAIGITARVADGERGHLVVKASKPAVYTAHDVSAVR